MTNHSVGLRISYDDTMMYTRCIISFMMQAPMTQKPTRCASKIFAAMAVRFSVASSHRLKCATARGSDLQSYETRLPHTHAFDIWRRVSVLVLATRTRKVPSKIGRYAHSRMLPSYAQVIFESEGSGWGCFSFMLSSHVQKQQVLEGCLQARCTIGLSSSQSTTVCSMPA
jgi:hypothetical protein